MTPLDEEARRLVSSAAQRVSVVTAVSPRALFDVLFVFVASLRMIRQLARLYGGRPGALGMIRLLSPTSIAHLAITGGMAASDSLIQQMLGHGIAAKLSAAARRRHAQRPVDRPPRPRRDRRHPPASLQRPAPPGADRSGEGFDPQARTKRNSHPASFRAASCQLRHSGSCCCKKSFALSLVGEGSSDSRHGLRLDEGYPSARTAPAVRYPHPAARLPPSPTRGEGDLARIREHRQHAPAEERRIRRRRQIRASSRDLLQRIGVHHHAAPAPRHALQRLAHRRWSRSTAADCSPARARHRCRHDRGSCPCRDRRSPGSGRAR